MMKNNKGITLIALAILIIIMLILAGVALRAVIGDDSTVNEAKDMSQSAKYNNVLESIKMDILAEKNKRDTKKIAYATIESICRRYGATCLIERVNEAFKIQTILLEDNSTIDFDTITNELDFTVDYSGVTGNLPDSVYDSIESSNP